MDHHDHVYLIRAGVSGAGGRWAELGSGDGAFTLALADLLGPQGRIVSLDKDRSALREQQRRMEGRFPEARVEYRQADFTRPLGLSGLDGVLMANSLHFEREKEALLRQVLEMLKPGGRLVLVEYNSAKGNPWVPHPLTYRMWEELAGRVGFVNTGKLASVPSRFLGEIFSAVSYKKDS